MGAACWYLLLSALAKGLHSHSQPSVLRLISILHVRSVQWNFGLRCGRCAYLGGRRGHTRLKRGVQNDFGFRTGFWREHGRVMGNV